MAATAAATEERRKIANEYLDYLRPLLNFVRRRLRYLEALGDIAPGTIQPEDVVDSTFARAMAHTESGPPPSRTYPWLRKLARRVLAEEVERARRRRRAVSLERELSPGPAAPPDYPRPPLRLIDVLPDTSSPVPDAVAEREELQRALAVILGQLPETWREPFLLHTRDGYSLRSVAKLEGIPPGEARRRVDNARQFLRARLAEEYEDREGYPPSEEVFAAVERTEPSAEHRARLLDRLTAPALERKPA